MSELTIPDYLKETEDDVHKRMLSNAPEGVSTTEGDLFWDNTRPTAIEIARLKKMELVNLLKSRFVQTAEKDDLDAIGEPDGVYRKQATKAKHLIQITGIQGLTIPKGKIVATIGTEDDESIQFNILEDVIIGENETVTVQSECSVPGIIGNVSLGSISVMYKGMNGVKTVSNIELIEKGVDAESDDDYRYRIILNSRHPGTSGNKYHYEKWALEVAGVGAVKVFPLWNGRGTVKCVIADSERHAVTESLIKKVKDYIDPNDGTGEGQAPIGATLTVTSATEKALNITGKLVLATGFTIEKVSEEFKKSLDEYLQSVAFNATYISVARIGSILLQTNGVIDYDPENLKINEVTHNIALTEEEIAVVGTCSLEAAY